MIIIIAAVAKNNVIGRGNDLPWHIPEDLKHFQNLTNGKTVLMGSNTFTSIIKRLGKPLPNRKNIVVTSDKNFNVPPGVIVYYSLQDALLALKNQEVWVIGGASIYKQVFPLADKMYITEVDLRPVGDTYFPNISKTEWREISRKQYEGFAFVEYERINKL